MTVATDLTNRASSQAQMALEDRFEVLKEIGDGSFGSVVLARVRTAGANVARRGSVVCHAMPSTNPDLACSHLLSLKFRFHRWP